ncbi:sugar transferase [Sphingomonas sp. H160509]|uniref:sugar transferase n=1 Tax=Sphingomonas sp. H160509 TaxID=2955313 RepID=UPI0020979F98|nr:sugar transferase [Sphingomonas sp. H160509]MDD1453002.1 sugar transferase [Sphingomonas sp. H160509]
MSSIVFHNTLPHVARRTFVFPQYLLGILIAAVAPMLGFAFFLNGGRVADIQLLTGLGCATAITAGFVGFRKLHLFPGSYSGYISMSLTFAYGALAVGMLMLRLDYSRPQLTTSYGVALIFFTLFQIVVVDRQRLRLGLVPGGRSERAPAVRHVVWKRLETPDDDLSDVNGVVVDLRHDHSAAWSAGIAEFALAGVPVHHTSDAYELLTGRVEVHHLSENTLGSLNPNDLYLRLKSFADQIAALVCLIILSPLLAVVAIAIKLDSPGPIFFTQIRIGQRGGPFRIFKLRTMIPEELMPPSGEPTLHRKAITVDDDPRITRLGRVLRRYRIDELPQLLNILLGNMSFIGPRPEANLLTKWYEKEIPFYHYRHIIKPGLTGWAQVNQGHVAEISDVRDKLYLDFYYIKYFSLWLDIQIILRTVLIVMTGFGAK